MYYQDRTDSTNETAAQSSGSFSEPTTNLGLNQSQAMGQTNNNYIVNSYSSSQSNQTNSQGASQVKNQVTNQVTNQAGQTMTTGTTSKQGKTVIGVFSAKNDAEKAVSELRNQGFKTEDINIVSKDSPELHQKETYDDDITDGALTGGTIGGIGGLLLGAGVVASVGAMAIPGIGPIIASGPIAAAIGGAVAGGVAGGLIDWGIPAESSHRYERSVAEGGILAVIRTDSSKVNSAAQILRQHGASDVESHNLTDR